jgi:hypothetical protein
MLRVFCYIAIFISSFAFQAYASSKSIKVNLSKNLEIFNPIFGVDYRNKDRALYYKHYDAGVVIPMESNFKISLNYRLIQKFDDDINKWKLEKRPHTSLQKLFDFRLVKILLKDRQEYRIKNNGKRSLRNRFKIMLKFNQIFSLYFKPFISNEFFYDLDKNKYNKNWLSIGIDLPKTKFGKYGFYYKYVANMDNYNNWTSDYSLILKASYKF